jgi:hypothetical protein
MVKLGDVDVIGLGIKARLIGETAPKTSQIGQESPAECKGSRSR